MSEPEQNINGQNGTGKPEEPAQRRRDFFHEALREAFVPLSGFLEKKITPVLDALSQIPDEFIETGPGPLDQPQATSSYPSPAASARRVERYLRPPGALPPGEYEAICARCGKCAEVCPAQCIKLDPDGYYGEGAPYIEARVMPCVVCDSLACMHACPSGALQVVEKLQIRMGTARVDQQECLRGSGQECRICVDSCPIREEAIGIGAETGKIRVKRNGCIGCGLCEKYCPTDPPAITVKPHEIRVDPIIA